MYFHDVDDLDILFARMEREEPPVGLTAHVLTAIETRSRRRRWLGARIFVGALAAAALLSFLVGYELRASGALDLIRLGLQDLDLIAASPVEFAMGLVESVPWVPTVLAGASLAVAARAAPLVLTPVVRLSARGR